MSLELTGAWLWETFGGKVTERASQRGGEAVRGLWKRINWQRAAEQYCGEMQRLYNSMQIIGMTEAISLANIFTDVYLLDRPSAWRHHNIDELKHRYERKQSEHDEDVVRRDDELMLLRKFEQSERGEDEDVVQQDVVRLDAVAFVQRNERLFLLGKPGAGKTTLLKHLVLRSTGGDIDAVPIFVGLKAWSDSGLELMSFLVKQFAICAFPDAQPFIEHILIEGQALVLFDGLDEVNLEGNARDRIIREVRDFVDQYARNRCVLTCRTAATDYQFEQFTYCELADFTEEQAHTFARNWFTRDTAKGNAFLVEFGKPEHERLRDLARTPLLLALLCIAFDETMRFPTRRVEVYEEALEALLKKWDASRRIRRDEVYKQLSLGRKRELLAQLAYESFVAGKLFLPQDALAQRIEKYLYALPHTDITEDIDGRIILRAIETQHGLLIERARTIYSFSHLTFQEYFAARYIAAHPTSTMFHSVTAHAHDVRWREVLLLVASMLDEQNTQAFFDAFERELHRLVEADPGMRATIRWIARKTEQDVEGDRLVARMDYLLLVLVSTISHSGNDHTAYLARDLDLDLDHNTYALTRAYALDRAHALAQARTRAFDLDRALDLARDLARAYSHPRKGKPSLEEVTWTNVLLQIDIIAAWERSTQRAHNFDDVTQTWHAALAATSLKEVRNTLNGLALPRPSAPKEEWQCLERDLRTVLQTHLDIGHKWALNEVQLTMLGNYLEANKRLLECLDVAVVSDRRAIRNRLLLPKTTTDRRRPPQGRTRR